MSDTQRTPSQRLFAWAYRYAGGDAYSNVALVSWAATAYAGRPCLVNSTGDVFDANRAGYWDERDKAGFADWLEEPAPSDEAKRKRQSYERKVVGVRSIDELQAHAETPKPQHIIDALRAATDDDDEAEDWVGHAR